MNVPIPVLTILSELIQNPPFAVNRIDAFKPIGFQINSRDWSCLLRDHDNQTWFVRPFELAGGDIACLSRDSNSKQNGWKLDGKRTAELRKSLRAISHKQLIPDPSNRFCILRSISHDAIVGCCDDLHLVADSLQSWGAPSKSIARDWQYQRESISPKAEHSTAETLVTPDGILLPLESIVSQFEHAIETSPETASEGHDGSSANRFPPAPDWPAVTTHYDHSESAFHVASNSEPLLEGLPIAKRLKKKNSKWFPIGIAMGLFAIALTTVWLIFGTQSHEKQSSEPSPAMSAISDLAPAGSLSSETHAATRTPTSETNQIVESTELLDPEVTTETNEAVMESSELSIESLLGQLRTKPDTWAGLTNVSASSIIHQAMEESSEAERAAPENSTETVETVAEKEIVQLSTSLRFLSAMSKESLSIGKPVVAKACFCEIELTKPDKLIVEPRETVAIEGAGMHLWRIALEDEEPELRLEIVSKPGSRWQIMTSVRLMERANTRPILIGPRDAQNVGNRLIQFSQWTEQAIETLRAARANQHGKSRIDFTGEIRRLEAQQRETNKAIDRWKVISRLSHLFFDQIDVEIRFNPSEKNAPRASD